MIELFTYSPAVTVGVRLSGRSGENDDVNLVPLLTGSYGVLVGSYHSPFGASEPIFDTITLRLFDGLTGGIGKAVGLPMLGGATQYFHSLWQLSNGTYLESSSNSVNTPFQILSAKGGSIGAAFTLDLPGTSGTTGANIHPLASGGFIASWNAHDSTNGWEGYSRVYDNTGHAVSNPITAGGAGDQGAPQVAILQDGTFAEAWVDKAGTWAVRVQVYDMQGHAQNLLQTAAEVPGNHTEDVTITALSTGNFVVIWRTSLSDMDAGTTTEALHAAFFNKYGSPLAGDKTLYSITAGQGEMAFINNAHVAALADGKFALVWNYLHHTDAPFTETTYALAQVFGSFGIPESSLYGLGSSAGHEGLPDVLTLPDGRFACTWTETDPDTGTATLKTQILDPRDHGISLNGNALANSYAGTNYVDVLSGLDGNDSLSGWGGNDKLYGGRGSDLLYGEDGKDRLFGGKGADMIFGGAGDDLISGGGGNDKLAGGIGKDTFVFAPTDGRDKIDGFQNDIDRLDLRAYHFASFDAAASHFSDQTGGGVIFAMGSDSIAITGIVMAQLSAADLIL